MEKIRKLKRQRNLLLIAALPFLPVILIYMLRQRIQKRRSSQRALQKFTNFHGRDGQKIANALDERRSDLERRLNDGVLREQIYRAQAIEPLISSFHSKIPIWLHPFSSKAFVHKVNSILELQDSVKRRRFDTIIVTSDSADPKELRALVAGAGRNSQRLLVIDTSMKGAIALEHEALPIYAASEHLGLLEAPDAEGVLFEFIRSMHPKYVVVADSEMLWDVISSYGDALAASTELSAFFSANRGNAFTQQYFYRYFEKLAKIHVIDEGARVQLVSWFMLCPDFVGKISSIGTEEKSHRSKKPVLKPAIGGTKEPLNFVKPDMDITVIVTAHNETVVTGPSMIAANAAIAVAEEAGYSVEKIIALDAASDRARACMSNPAYADWTLIDINERDLGRTRNRVVRMSRGRYIAFLDADDLFSEYWLAEAARDLDAAEVAGERIILHPELNWIFDGDEGILAITPQESPIFSPALFYFTNYYDSLCMAPREAHLAVPYVSRDIPNGLSYQDHQFAIETIDQGWIHRIAKDTIIFKRRRDASLVTESRDRQSVVRQVEPMAIDKVMQLGAH